MNNSPSTTERDPAEWTAAGLLSEISDVGLNEDGSYSRYSLTEVDGRLRKWLTSLAEQLGLDVCVDANANLWAWWGQPGPSAVLTGSHLDSVPGGGAYDGPLGVISSLLAIARLKAAGVSPTRSVALVVFTDEEGAGFGLPCLGSRLATGVHNQTDALALKTRDGRTLSEAWRQVGLDPARIGPLDWVRQAACFIELHVEQGRGLADLGMPVAIATAVRPHGRWRATITGRANHAGTTLIPDRNDPTVPLAHTVLAAREAAARADAVATVGRIHVVPGGTNVIAGQVTMWLDCRAEDSETVLGAVEEIQRASRTAATAEGCQVDWVRESWTGRTVFDPYLQERMAHVLGRNGMVVPHLSTGAGHDAAILAEVTSSGMLFVRNPTGASHTPAETVSDEDAEAGVEALCAVLQDLIS